MKILLLLKILLKGYLKLPAQTENKFVSVYNPVLNTVVKAYRTGDIIKLSTDGEIEFIGRDDDVVKVNGSYLVALNEVEKRFSLYLAMILILTLLLFLLRILRLLFFFCC